eukprot:GEMP01001888.1.p1 GENE.GEMP01001888.1~~GEMP01001888.1.p1  ORF type:complete len:1099 (+),score=280.74 GEMP01001888.1:206-3502(+)
MAEKPPEKKFTRRDHMLSIEKWAQELWDQNNAFEVDADSTKEKYFTTFPYPYMNGKLHIGHAFSFTKSEFSARFRALDGKQVLQPFAFHCTGMPIAAAAQKLRKEAAAAEEPEKPASPEPVTPEPASPEQATAEGAQANGDKANGNKADQVVAGVFKGKKTKAVAKSGQLTQTEIMLSMGIPQDQLVKFQDPVYWLDYFIPLAKSDLELFGAAIDWRRQFYTTDANPYYDAFIQWQFRRLKKGGYIKFGKRECIFSPRTDQPCADHDRASGEGAGPQEYTMIKLLVKENNPLWADKVGDKKVFFCAATLRPETMYGQTNCFVLPEGEYGLYEMNNDEVFVCSQRAATNMIYQDLGPYTKDGFERNPKCITKVMGKDLVGTPLKAPLARYDTVYALPMFTILMGKGTGLVTSVPADSPDDYACLMDWKTKAKWRDDFGVKEEWVKDVDVVNIITIPDSEYGEASAPYIVQKMKIQSHKDQDKLSKAKKEVYLKGFYEGILTIGPHAGTPVKDAKTKVRDDMIQQNQAFVYYEPESEIMSRSGEECVVALCDQWYITYGDEEWTERVRKHAEENFTVFNVSAHKTLLRTIDWMKSWACSRTFGLGTRLPWDKEWLVESLSDSTVYFAYYTIAHFLQGGVVSGTLKNGKPPGPYKITVEDLTDDVFDYIFDLREELPQTNIEERYLNEMRGEFLHWYPMDLRCSGKDLITNHLTMALFNHAAIWSDPKRYWPKAYFTNGHIMVDSEKMSKSKGNFLTLNDAICLYSADCTRMAMADAGDTQEDANFMRDLANQSILRLTTYEEWAEKCMEYIKEAPVPETKTFMDEVFENEINRVIISAYQAFDRMQFREAVRLAWFEMENLRGEYRIFTDGKYHPELLSRFLTAQAIMLSPICPHFCEHLWVRVLKKDGLCCKQRWPTVSAEYSEVLHRRYIVLQVDLRSFRLSKEGLAGKKKKEDVVPPTSAIIYVAKEYKPFQRVCLEFLQKVPLNDEGTGPASKDYMRELRDLPAIKALPKDEAKKAMPFASFMMNDEFRIYGKDALDMQLPFDELEMLQNSTALIKSQLGLEAIEIVDATVAHEKDTTDKRSQAQPAKPQIVFFFE